ncbi:MAG: PQQ-binding-like beta-propeller repeat protein [Kiritimatiellae bacterium]|jgi:outer membrane protein assembly factor BamB|nr:PQQ-binding-like beta-propeller repeat protein [Kiritimatiellia bacterium]
MDNKKIIARYELLRQCARGMAFVALVFTFTVGTLLSLDWYKSGQSITVRSEVLERALANVRDNPQNQAAVELARELDQLARHTYFNSMTFRQNGMMLLVLGLIAAAAGFGLAWRLGLQIPDPRGIVSANPEKGDKLAVRALLGAGVCLTVFAVILQVRHSPATKPVADRALRAGLTNKALTNGQQHVCACMLGPKKDELMEQWPNLRGPTMSGRTAIEKAPLKWDGTKGSGIKWKVELPASGSSTPAVWNNKIFITTGSVKARRCYCYDTESGKQLWMTDIPDGTKSAEELPQVTEDTGFAASSPACDADRVYVIYGTGDLAALDHSGNIVWQRYLGRPENSYGHASSLTYQGEMLLIQWDQDEDAKIMAVNTKSGKIIWETPREVGLSWSSPIVMTSCDKPIVLVHACDSTWGVELATGKKLWEVNAVGGEVAPAVTWEGDTWVAANCYSRMIAFKLKPGADPEQLWIWEDGNLPDVASPVMMDGLIYIVTDSGEVICHDLKDGKEVWLKEFEDGFYASPIIAAGRLYAVDREKGVFRVFETGREGKEIAVNPMGEGVNATPAFVGESIYVRGSKHLWCIVGE